MTLLMFDTPAKSAFMRGQPNIKEALQQAAQIYVSPVVLGELHARFQRGSQPAENERRLERFLSSPRIRVAEIGDETALRYAEIFNFLRRVGTPIPTNDIWIAASAMQYGLHVLTTDVQYTRVPQVIVTTAGSNRDQSAGPVTPAETRSACLGTA